MRQALLYGLLTFALAQATPTRKPPTPVVNRRQAQATNIPSPYPGKDSPACPGEPKYLNFFDTPADTKRVQRLHHVFCNEVSPLITAGSTATSDSDRTIYERFFAESDKDSVNDVWGKLFDFQTKQPSAIVSNLIFDNFDFNTQCGETPGATLPAGSESVPLGTYTGLDTSDNLEKIHFCQVAYEYIDLADITCNTLDSYPSIQMDSTGRYMLHEFTQSSAVGPQTHCKSCMTPLRSFLARRLAALRLANHTPYFLQWVSRSSTRKTTMAPGRTAPRARTVSPTQSRTTSPEMP